MFECKICHELFEKVNGLLTHIQFRHKEYTPESYYRQFIMKTGEGFCKSCGKPTQFHNIQDGYRKYCNKKCAWSDPEVKAKRAATNSKKTDAEIKEWHQKNVAARRLNGKCITEAELSRRQQISETHFRTFFDKCNCEFLGYDKTVHFRCRKCNNEDSFTRSVIDRYDRTNDYDICHYCNDRRFVSTPERELKKFITSIYNGKIISGDRNLLNGRELDILIPEKNLAIEFDGLYWHNENVVNSKYHLVKTKLCEQKGIQLIHIFENEWLDKKEIVKSRLRGLLGCNERIYARKCKVREVSYKASCNFLNENHIQGNCVSKWRYGLYYDDELVSIMTFGKSRFKDEYEMLRFANKMNVNVIGGASKLFSHFIKDHSEINAVVSFADRRWSKGNLYEKIGFAKIEETAPSYYYIIDRKLHNRIEFQKHKLVAAGADSNKTEHEIMKENGALRIYDCGCLKYQWNR